MTVYSVFSQIDLKYVHIVIGEIPFPGQTDMQDVMCTQQNHIIHIMTIVLIHVDYKIYVKNVDPGGSRATLGVRKKLNQKQ